MLTGDDMIRIHKEKALEYNKLLKEIKTYNEFKDFYDQIKNEGFGLCGKKRGFEAFSFKLTNSISNYDRISYIYDDGYSYGNSYVKNLWRVLEVK